GRGAAADDIARIKREVAREIFEIFAEAEHHILGVVALTAFAIHQGLEIGIGRIGLAHGDTGTHRGRAVEILGEGEVERAARDLARRADAPIGEDGHAPDMVLQLRRLQIDAALAQDDRDLALVIEPVAALGIDELALGPDDLAAQFPESPEAALADFLIGVALIRLAAHLHRHRGGVIGEIAAGACDARLARPRCVQFYLRHRAHDALALGAELVLRLAEEMIERLLRRLERARPALDEARQIRGRERFGHFVRARLAQLLAQIFGRRVAEIDDLAVMEDAGPPLGTENDDLHALSPFPCPRRPAGS